MVFAPGSANAGEAHIRYNDLFVSYLRICGVTPIGTRIVASRTQQ